MFRRKDKRASAAVSTPERITSVLGPGINWQGKIHGKGGIRIEGTLEGEIGINGIVVIGETGRVKSKNLSANTVIIAGSFHGAITAERLEIRGTGRVWADVVTVSLSTVEGAFLRGQVRMEEEIELPLPPDTEGLIREEAPVEENESLAD